jgi:hypothetical protein
MPHMGLPVGAIYKISYIMKLQERKKLSCDRVQSRFGTVLPLTGSRLIGWLNNLRIRVCVVSIRVLYPRVVLVPISERQPLSIC